MGRKPLTSAQESRQRARSSGTGKYRKHNPCELCGKSVGEDYYSLSWTNEAPFHGRGLVLHEKCADVLEGAGKSEAPTLLGVGGLKHSR